MSRRSVQRVAILLLMFAGLALLTVRRDVAGSTGPTQGGGVGRPRSFSAAYDYCYVDEKGRPMVFHRRRLVFFLPQAPPEVNDRTFIETDECQ